MFYVLIDNVIHDFLIVFFFFQAEDGIRDAQESRGLGDVYKRQIWTRTDSGTRAQVGIELGPRFGRLVHTIVDQTRAMWEPLQYGGELLVPFCAVVLRYSADCRPRIAAHVDDCEANLNICLQEAESGGDIKFFLPEANWSVRQAHVVGQGIAHRGEIPHGTYPVTAGERVQLVIKFRSAPLTSDSEIPVCFSRFFELSHHVQDHILLMAGAFGVTRFAAAGRRCSMAAQQELWRQLYLANAELCSLISVSQLLGEEEDDDDDDEDFGLLHLMRRGYSVSYVKAIRLMDGDWRNAYRVALATQKAMPKPKRGRPGLLRTTTGIYMHNPVEEASWQPEEGFDQMLEDVIFDQ
eukprot:TRINITY_DN6696_c0_g1_i4.p1 TRINITY_DN6696_c0_g1~~TRINITY_DN6696_c0_g1_i4.p1  ORF type:complete len:351 (+),score=91.41 TRINITY_DN6696_c0_g1_i4:88-1140(+)